MGSGMSGARDAFLPDVIHSGTVGISSTLP